MENATVLREWFERVDSNRSGNITALQLQGALSVGNLDFSLSIVQQMIRMYDFDGNGTMNFEEFVALNKFLLKVQNLFTVLERTVPPMASDITVSIAWRTGRSQGMGELRPLPASVSAGCVGSNEEAVV
ncbi:hypothetical protein C4D60_Mb05t21000 [Musa balbisiana]|uniref:EF-hand domain-containing protein n=1 Tax=Musa balbisiana TaxID=52838 RepID=A0A4S8JXQ6_MUSBA|nr:hypothetical protein C4D60_Mb05t21000 [Musa balbisiana]